MGIFMGSLMGSSPQMNPLLLQKPKTVWKYNQSQCKPPQNVKTPNGFGICSWKNGRSRKDFFSAGEN